MSPPGEFSLIDQYLTGLGARRDDVALGVGDDAAMVQCAAGESLLLALDTLVEGVHFPADCPAHWVGHRALAVNLSDLAAMGAEPAWALVGLTLPAADEAWVAGFARGLDALAKRHGVAIVGGDVTRGPLTVSLQITGYGGAHGLRRDGARAGDELWVSGRPGEAAAGLRIWQQGDRQSPRWQGLLAAFLEPSPRVALGRRLRGIATAAIDVSDGVIADAGHIARASGVGLSLDMHQVRPSARLVACLGGDEAQRCYLGGGDDYELLFTAPPRARSSIRQAARDAATPVRCIGEARVGDGVALQGGESDSLMPAGYQHFSAP
ncbi:thiamine-phosphate kinase [Spiribacter sp. 2438]|uniref:thiamine-phosphate kinase n=1 Tax=Spiribacter sp. 2438 TaxID=2666185 RepID=UPI0012B1259F|nr:thiamine-phosphate kinase [Spiribacter sp. 2438]QGM21226.1 thiamine-phosphate kinase [Spiribacter sp. 2438]